MTNSTHATVKEIAEALAIPVRTAQDRSKKGNWPFQEKVTPAGAKVRLYALSTLPKEIYDALLIHRSGVKPAPAEPDPAYRPTLAEIYQREVQGLAPNAQRRMDVRLEILAAFLEFSKGQDVKRDESRHRFAEMYNRGLIAVPAWVRESKRHICRNSLINWENEQKKGKLRALGGKYKGRAGTGVFDRVPSFAKWVIGRITDNPGIKISNLYKSARAEIGETVREIDRETGEVLASFPLPSIRSIERYIVDWKERHPALWAKATNPDLYRNKYEYAAGEMYGDILRRNQLWEIDASPADVMCTDGRHSIYVCLDIHSRWPRVRVTKTPRTAAALLLIRDCIVGWPGQPETAWGVPDCLRTDNGSDFVSNHFKDTVRRLGIEQDICDPYSPKQKAAVERMIGTIQHQFMELQPGFIGHNVTDRRQIELRKAFSQRLGQDDKDAFCVELSAADLQARLNDWVEKVYVHTTHTGLDGKTPFEVRTAYRGRLARIEGEGALEMLLAAPADGDGTRTVTKKGIRVAGIDYYHPALMPGEVVHVRLDPDDLGKVYVYRGEPWDFVGIAINPEREGVSRVVVAAEVKARQKQTLDEGMAGIRAAQRDINQSTVSLDIVAAAEARTGSLAAFPGAGEAHSTPDIAAASAAARARTRKAPVAEPMTATEQARVKALEAEMAAPAAKEPVDPKTVQFARAIDLERRLAAGEAVSEIDRRWLGRFQDGPVYRSRKAFAEQHGLEAALEV